MRNVYPFASLLRIVSKTVGIRLSLFFLLCGVLAISASGQTRRYVNASAAAGGNGSSWATAYKDLQAALDVAVSGDEIWVAKGTYKPSKDEFGNTTPADSRTRTFLLKNGVKLYGGFAGWEALLSARNIKINETTLSGDLSNNDGEDFTNRTDNCYHVVGVNKPTVLTVIDGFTISGGTADNGNFDTKFLGQNFGFYYGGGIYAVEGGNNLTINNCVFTGNTGYMGGAIRASGAPTISNCVFVKNRAQYAGGAIFYSYPTSSTLLTNSVFFGNTANDRAGAIMMRGHNPLTMINTTIVGNYAPNNGGGLFVDYASVDIKNSIIWGNTGGGFNGIGGEGSNSITGTYSNIQSGSIWGGSTGCISADPAFISITDPDGADNLWGTADDGLQLHTTSPSANKGNNADAVGIDTDITGAARVQGTVNMGAYETTMAIIYVNASATGANNGSSWANAFTNLQSALNAAVEGDKIFVAAGTYKPSVDPDGSNTTRKQTFLLKSGVAIYGGYNASTGARDVKANKTILSGDFNGDDVGFNYNNENAYHVVAAKGLSAATLLDGFTITGGNANTSSSFLGESFANGWGGAIYVYQSGTHLTINNCVISGNEQLAGALNVRNASPRVTNCVFVGNKSNEGGAAYNSNGGPSYINCLFTDNSTLSYGGSVMANAWATTSIINCTMYGNSANSNDGGTIYNYNSSNVTVTNSIIWGNTSYISGREGIINSTTTSATSTVSYSNVQNFSGGTGNITVEPQFVNATDPDGADNLWGTADDGLLLVNTSPVVDKGNNTPVSGIATDITGSTRIQNGTVNMGAYEMVKVGQAITGLPATVTKTYGDASYTLSATGGASGNPIVYTSSNTAVATVSGNTVTIVGAGTAIIKASQAGNSTYAAAEATQTLTVNKRAITVKADALSKEYGDADPALTYTITEGSLVGTDAFTGSLSRATGENGGYHYTINQGTLALNSNYTITFVSEWFNINKRAITVTADAKSKTYGDADPALTYTVTSGSLKSGDSFTGTLSRNAGPNVGTYAINQGTLAVNSNYVITFVSKNLTIEKRPVTVTANAHSKVYGNTDPAFTYTVSPALLSGDAFSGSLGRATGENVGTYAITIGTLNNNNYNITLVSNSFSIEKRVITVTANALSKVYGDADPSLTYTVTTGSLYAGDKFTGALTRAAGENAGTYAINQGTLALSSNYTLNYVSKLFTVSKRAVAIKADAVSKTYGDADPSLTYKITSGSLKSGDAFTGSLARTSGEDAGTYAINQGSLALTANYDLTFTGNTLTISKRAITVTADAVSKIYGDVDPSLTYKLTAGTLKSGDAFTGTLTRAAGENIGTYAISQNTLTVNGNYTITFVSANFTIGKRTIAVKADAQGKTYGDADPALTYTITSGTLKSGDAFTGVLTRATGENVGTYTISQGTLALSSNYTINFTGATLTIDKKTITVTADAVSKVYGEADPALTYKVSAGSLVGSDALTGNLIRTIGENAGTYTITVGTLKNNNYNINYVPNSLTIAKRPITIKATDASKTVSQTKTFAGTEYTITAGSLASGDAISSVTLNSTGAGSGAAVGTYDIVPSAVAGISAANYAITYINGTLTVTAKPVLTVKANDASKVYGEVNPSFTYTITGFVDGDNQSSAITGAPDLTTSVTTTSPAGTYSGAITAAIGTLASGKYEFSFENGSITVDKRAITVTADAQTKEYGDADPALTYKVTAGTVVNGDTFTGDLSRAEGESIGTYAIDKGTLDIGSNYTVTFVAGNLTVGKRNITVTADAQNKVYGGLDPILTYKVTSGSLKAGDAFTGALSRVAGEDAGTYAIEQGTLALNSNYNLTFISKNLTIGKRFITISADAVSKTYGEADPALTYKISSGTLKTGDVLSGSLNRAAGENVGTYAIAIGTLANANYNITFESNLLTINKRAITITADAQSKVYGEADPELTYKVTAGTLKTGDAFTGSLSRAIGENAGTYAIGIGSLANSNYNITFVGAALTVDRKPITVTANAVSKIYGELDPALTYTVSPALVSGDAFSGAMSRATGENVGNYAINIGTLNVSDNYLVSFVTNNVTISKRDITVTADAQSKTYGDADPAFTYTITSGSLAGSDAFTGSLERVAGEDAGTYAINAGTLAVNSNYQLNFVADNLTIGKRAITIIADAQSKVYGEADPELTYTITSGTLVGSDVLSGNLSRAAGEDAGHYTIHIGTLNNANYNISFTADNLTISKRPISISADALNKVYGETDPVLTYKITAGSLVGADAFTGSLSRETGENAGTYAINQNTLALSDNYTLSFTGADLTIDKRAITIKANDASKGEGQTKTFAGTEYSITAGSLAAGDVITSVSLNSTGAAASAAVGTYDIVPSNAAGISTANYSITYVNGTLTVNTCPAVTITTQPVAQVKCAGDEVTFEVVATGTGLTYQWYKGNDQISGATSASYTITGVTAAHAGDYKVEVMGCSNVTSNVASLTVNTVPVPTITAAGNILTSSATTGNQWYLEGAEIPGATAQTYQVQAAGRYTVKVTSGSCSATSAEFNFVPTRIDGPGTWNGEVVAYPNPVGKILYIKNNSGRKLQLQLVDVAGVKVRTSTLAGAQGSMNVEGLAAGAYYLVVTDQQTQRSISINLIKL